MVKSKKIVLTKLEKSVKKREAKTEKKKAINEKYADLLKEAIAHTWEPDDSIQYILHVGKTNSGKTYNAVQRLKEVGSGIYLAPLRLLAWEIYDKLISEGLNCDLITGEEQIKSGNADFTSSTIEMANYGVKHGVAIIDEALMLGDEQRGHSWLEAILNLKANEIHIILNEETLDLLTKILDLTGRKYEIKKYEMLQKFKFSDTQFNFSKRIPHRGVFVTFSRIGVLINKMKLENLGFNCSVLYGNLPPEVKKRQISDFIEGKTHMMITTDVIGMGINVPCDYIVFLETEKYDGVTNRGLNSVEVKQIAGRTGRYGLSNADAFVSCTSKSGLIYLNKRFYEQTKLDKSFFGLNYEIFSMFDENTTIRERLNLFKDVDFIPEKLKVIIHKESINKYLEIEPHVEKYKFDLKTQWVLLTAPVKYNNQYYFEGAIDKYHRNKILSAPITFETYVDAKGYEDTISAIELYLNLTRNLNHDPDEKLKITERKELLIDNLTKILMDKKLSHKKKCKLCDYMLSLTHPYPYCEKCYQNKVRSSYYEDDYGRW